MATAEKTVKQVPVQTFKEETVIVLTLTEREAQLLQIIQAKIAYDGPARRDMAGVAGALNKALGYGWQQGAEKYARSNGHTEKNGNRYQSWVTNTFDANTNLKAL